MAILSQRSTSGNDVLNELNEKMMVRLQSS